MVRRICPLRAYARTTCHTPPPTPATLPLHHALCHTSSGRSTLAPLRQRTTACARAERALGRRIKGEGKAKEAGGRRRGVVAWRSEISSSMTLKHCVLLPAAALLCGATSPHTHTRCMCGSLYSNYQLHPSQGCTNARGRGRTHCGGKT